MDPSGPNRRALVPAPARTPVLLGGLAARTLEALRSTRADLHGSTPLSQIYLSDALVYRVKWSRNGQEGGREREKVIAWLAAVDPDRQVVLDMSEAIYGSPGSLRQLFRFLSEPDVRSRPFLFYISETDLPTLSLALGEERHSALAVVGPRLDDSSDGSDMGFNWLTELEFAGLGPRRVEPVGVGSTSFLAALDSPRIPSVTEPAGQWLVLEWLVSYVARECWFEPAQLPREPFEPRRPRWHRVGRVPPTQAEIEAWRHRHEQWEREHADWEQMVREQIVCRVDPAPAEAVPPPPDVRAHFFPSGGTSSSCRGYASPETDHVDAGGRHWRFVPMSVPHTVCRECEAALGLRPHGSDAVVDDWIRSDTFIAADRHRGLGS